MHFNFLNFRELAHARTHARTYSAAAEDDLTAARLQRIRVGQGRLRCVRRDSPLPGGVRLCVVCEVFRRRQSARGEEEEGGGDEHFSLLRVSPFNADATQPASLSTGFREPAPVDTCFLPPCWGSKSGWKKSFLTQGGKNGECCNIRYLPAAGECSTLPRPVFIWKVSGA